MKESKPIWKLKGLRAERGMKQTAVANVLGISTATYNRKENGTGYFESWEIQLLLKLFDVKFEDIFVSE